MIEEKISIAPMVDRTTEHFRNFVRMYNQSSTLYTEMITTQAILNGDLDRILKFNEAQHPVVLQIATDNPDMAKEAVRLANSYPYDEININAGCPSDRVAGNKMGAFLMSEPELVRDIVREIRKVTDKPISVKHRIGIDGTGILEGDRIIDSYEDLIYFVDTIAAEGVTKFTAHARVAILKGLSPHENRTIPPLKYDVVYNLKKDRPNLDIEINGGIKTIEQAQEHLKYVDRVMIGRAAYENPMILNEKKITRCEILEKLVKYLEKMEGKPYHMTMHTLGLFYATKYSKLWKQVASNTNVTAEDVKKFMSKLKKYDKI